MPRKASLSPHLYPAGHPPFVPGRLCLDDQHVLASVTQAARRPGVVPNLISAYTHLYVMRSALETSRVHLFRAEHFMETQPPDRGDIPRGEWSGVTSGHIFLAHDAAVLLESLKAATRCLEEWMESKSRHAILATYPRLRRVQHAPAP